MDSRNPTAHYKDIGFDFDTFPFERLMEEYAMDRSAKKIFSLKSCGLLFFMDPGAVFTDIDQMTVIGI